MTALLVALGAVIGGPGRYLTDRLLQGRHDSAFPWGTFAANVVGSGLLGFFVALPVHTFGPQAMAFAGIGFCGAFTTYSTFSFETIRLATSGARTMALFNVTASVLAGSGAAYCGVAVAQALCR